jgi:hypothetical protein
VQSVFRDTLGYQWSRRCCGEWKPERAGVGAAADYLYDRGYFVNQHIFRQSMNQILF